MRQAGLEQSAFDKDGGGKCSEITFSIPAPAPGMELGLGPLAGTAWVLSAHKGSAGDLKLSSTWQDKAALTVPLSSRAPMHAPLCLCLPASLCSYVQAGQCRQAELSLPVCRPCQAG